MTQTSRVPMQETTPPAQRKTAPTLIIAVVTVIFKSKFDKKRRSFDFFRFLSESCALWLFRRRGDTSYLRRLICLSGSVGTGAGQAFCNPGIAVPSGTRR